MVNVSVLGMALARSLNIGGPLLREFGFAALTHDFGKLHTPLVNTWEPDGRGDFKYAVVEAVDPDSVQLDPLTWL